jgi:hypothetical protein
MNCHHFSFAPASFCAILSGFTLASTMAISSGQRRRHSSSLRSPKLIT